jgi:hypothetical protein
MFLLRLVWAVVRALFAKRDPSGLYQLIWYQLRIG